jgi:prefoldin subunit 5
MESERVLLLELRKTLQKYKFQLFLYELEHDCTYLKTKIGSLETTIKALEKRIRRFDERILRILFLREGG